MRFAAIAMGVALLIGSVIWVTIGGTIKSEEWSECLGLGAIGIVLAFSGIIAMRRRNNGLNIYTSNNDANEYGASESNGATDALADQRAER